MTFGAIGSVQPVKTGQLGSAPEPGFLLLSGRIALRLRHRRQTVSPYEPISV